MDCTKCIPLTTARRQSEERHFISSLKANGYPENFIKSVNQPNNALPNSQSLRRTQKHVSIPYVRGVSERILNRENIKTAFILLKTFGHVFKKPKAQLTKGLLKGIVYKVSCRTYPFTYIGETKRSWKSWGTEHKPWTSGNVGSAVKQHAETICHNLLPATVSILEMGVKATDNIISYIHSSTRTLLMKEHPSSYASLVSFLRRNEH